MTMKLLAFFLLTALHCHAQFNFRDLAFLANRVQPSAAAFFPTNLPSGTSATAWWEPSRAYGSNSRLLSATDRSNAFWYCTNRFALSP